MTSKNRPITIRGLYHGKNFKLILMICQIFLIPTVTAMTTPQSIPNGPWLQISMGGKGAWRDNIVVERLWKTVKYERVYLYAYDSVNEARVSIMQYLAWYNQSRPHSSLEKMTPDEAYGSMLPAVPLAA